MLIKAFAIFATITAFAFNVAPGGEGFEIYLNNTPVIQQYGADVKIVRTLSLNAQTTGDQLTVKYHHCGKAGQNRIIRVRDEQHRSLLTLDYGNANKPGAGMLVNTKEIIKLKKPGRSLELFYSSNELPGGRTLANIVIAD